jgi:hypothetical protein
MSRVRAHEAFDTEPADLRDWPLPIFAEHTGTIGDLSDPTYSEPIVRAWNKKVEQADASGARTPRTVRNKRTSISPNGPWCTLPVPVTAGQRLLRR